MSKIKGAVSHHEAELAELRADRELAVAYLKAAMESLDDPDDRAAGLLALRTVAEAYGGGCRRSRHQPRISLSRAVTQRQPNLENTAGRLENRRSSSFGRA